VAVWRISMANEGFVQLKDFAESVDEWFRYFIKWQQIAADSAAASPIILMGHAQLRVQVTRSIGLHELCRS
jgi:hypothetical protein